MAAHVKLHFSESGTWGSWERRDLGWHANPKLRKGPDRGHKPCAMPVISTGKDAADRENLLTMLERRQHARQRFEAIEYVELTPENGGFLLDLSEYGAAVQMARAVSVETAFDFWFSLGHHARVQVRGQVVWTDRTGKAAGVRFVHVPQLSLEQVREWLVIHAGEQGLQWNIISAGADMKRFAAETSAPAALAAQDEFCAVRGAPQPANSAIPTAFAASAGAPPYCEGTAEERAAAPQKTEPEQHQTSEPARARTGLFSWPSFGLPDPAAPTLLEHHAHSKRLTGQVVRVAALAGVAAFVVVAIGLSFPGRHRRFASRAGAASIAARSTGISAQRQPPTAPVATPIHPAAVPDTTQQWERGHAPVTPSLRSPSATAAAQPRAQTNPRASPSTSGVASGTRSAPQYASEADLWKAVEAGDSSAELSLADLYAFGKGVPRNCAQARILLEAAARNGSPQARTRLQNLAASCP
jgi:PilZ domain